MTDEAKDFLVDEIAAMSGDVPDRIKFKRFLRTLRPFDLRERYEILIEERARDVRDGGASYAAMLEISGNRINAETQRTEGTQGRTLRDEISNHKLRITDRTTQRDRPYLKL